MKKMSFKGWMMLIWFGQWVPSKVTGRTRDACRQKTEGYKLKHPEVKTRIARVLVSEI